MKHFRRGQNCRNFELVPKILSAEKIFSAEVLSDKVQDRWFTKKECNQPHVFIQIEVNLNKAEKGKDKVEMHLKVNSTLEKFSCLGFHDDAITKDNHQISYHSHFLLIQTGR